LKVGFRRESQPKYQITFSKSQLARTVWFFQWYEKIKF